MFARIADEIKVALVGAVCILGSAIILKNVLDTKPDVILSNGPAYLTIIYLITRGAVKKGATKTSNWHNPLYWSLAIIFITLLTIVLHLV